MPDLDLSALRKVAEAAKLGSHGQWLQDGATRVMLPDKQGNPWYGRLVADVRDPIDVQHVAAFCPATVLALLDELENAAKVAHRLQYISDQYGDDHGTADVMVDNEDVQAIRDLFKRIGKFVQAP